MWLTMLYPVISFAITELLKIAIEKKWFNIPTPLSVAIAGGIGAGLSTVIPPIPLAGAPMNVGALDPTTGALIGGLLGIGGAAVHDIITPPRGNTMTPVSVGMFPPFRMLLFWLAVAWSLYVASFAFAQATSGKTFEISCPGAIGAASIEVVPLTSGRQGVCVDNTAGTDVRVGINLTGTPNLDGTNSKLIKSGSNSCDSQPSPFYGRVVCESTSNSATVVGVYHTYRP